MAQPQIDIITPDVEAPLDSQEGRAAFEELKRKIYGSQSDRETRLAALFSGLPEPEQQIWLKAAGLSVMTADLCAGGYRVRQWSDLDRRKRQMMMIAYGRMNSITSRGEAWQ